MPCFEHIKKVIGNGGLYPDKGSNAFRLRISKTYELFQLIELINGKFRTPKIKYLYRAIDQVNLKHGTNISKLPLDTWNLNSNPQVGRIY